MKQTLHHQLSAIAQENDDLFFEDQVPSFVYQNLRPTLGKRPYQQEAFGRFVYCYNGWKKEEHLPLHLLFHMATGSGKTVVMAGIILYLYQQGYRHFLFFVNSTTILEKTKDNFLNATSSKYLFNSILNANGKEFKIKEGANFETGDEDDIHIVFTTIQGLHQQLNKPAENCLTYEDFEDKKIVLLSDEAHHINAETKRGTSLTADEKEELVSWEATVRRLVNTNAKNILLEFTATVDLSLPVVAEKYNEKIMFDYSLKQFRQDKYSKEVRVLQSGQELMQRALQAVLLSQYRYKVFQKWGLFIKPVVLFKSKTIKESEAFFEAFVTKIKNLSATELLLLNTTEKESAVKKVFSYLAEQNISIENFVTELQADFSEEKLVSVNSRDDSEKKQLAINTLEDEDNPYRAVFAVDKLNEGWDVLNLFDIVRCYDSADTATGTLKKTTLSEAQLIGRGARYFPFIIKEDQTLAQRKFDDEEEHELRIGEELYYHSPYNPKYIHELNNTLVQMGMKDEGKMKVGDTKRLIVTKGSATKKSIFEGHVYKVTMHSLASASHSLFDEEIAGTEVEKSAIYPMSVIPERIIRKAMDSQPFFYFNNLKKNFPHLRSATEFIHAKNFLGGVSFQINGSDFNDLEAAQKLMVATTVLEQVKDRLLQ